MKTVNLYLEENQHRLLWKLKGEKTWFQFLVGDKLKMGEKK